MAAVRITVSDAVTAIDTVSVRTLPHRMEEIRVAEVMGIMLASDELLTIEEVAQRLKVNVDTIYSLTRNRAKVRAGMGHSTPIPHRKVGRQMLFSWQEVVAWLNTQPGFGLAEEDRSSEPKQEQGAIQ
jgi:hypothetical protein